MKATWRGLSWLTVGLLWGLSRPTATAQMTTEAQKRYSAAVRLVRAGDYERAKSDLNVIIQQRGPLAPYANYYYALSAYRQKNFTQARSTLKQSLELFADWRKQNDVQYLLAAVDMELGQYEEALSASQQINDRSFQPDITKLEQTFIPRINDLNRLKKLNQAFPGDRIVGLSLIDLIQRSAGSKEDLELSDRLTNRFGVPGTVMTSPVGARPTNPSTTNVASRSTTSSASVPIRNSRSRGYYNVAVLFPFRLDEFTAEKRSRSNQYVYDLYEGIKMAKTKLQDEGITINLFAYDIDNDANKTLELVNSPACAQTDLIVGPLYIEPNRIASAYANQSNIVLVNPIATSSELVANQPLSFLAQPSLAQQAQRALEQIRTLNGGRRVAVYFGTARKDSLLAVAYQRELIQQNYQIVDFRKLSGNAQTMANAMRPDGRNARPMTADPTASIPLSHVFFASSNDDDGARLLEALSKRHVSGPLVATASAFDFYRNTASTLNRRDLYLLYPDFIDTSREPVTLFQEEYVSKYNTIPSVFASEGYDMMLFFGRQLSRNGLQARNRNQLYSDTDDYLLSGFDYTQSNENHIVPIVQLTDGKLTKIN